MPLLYKRDVNIMIGAKNGLGFSFKDFNCSFSVEKNSSQEMNKAEVSIYNVSSETYDELNNAYRPQLQIYAGYANEELYSKIFVGDIKAMSREKSGADWVLKLTALDGLYDVYNTVLAKSYAPDTDIETIISDVKTVLKRLGSDLVEIFADNMPKKKLRKGFTFYGGVLPILAVLLRQYGYGVYVNNNALVISPYVGFERENEGYLLTPETGLIGSPSIEVVGTEKKIRRIVKVKTLLLPDLDIGNLVKLNSETVNDVFTIRAVTFKGDFTGTDWYADLELI